jgi:hypothetical protein
LRIATSILVIEQLYIRESTRLDKTQRGLVDWGC